jgi:hypothetical protein
MAQWQSEQQHDAPGNPLQEWRIVDLDKHDVQGEVVATVYLKAAAPLIAAAPKMLAALETLIRWHDAVPAKEFIPGPIHTVIDRARAAIADATELQ